MSHDVRDVLEQYLADLRRKRSIQQGSIDDLVEQIKSTDSLIDATEKVLAGLSIAAGGQSPARKEMATVTAKPRNAAVRKHKSPRSADSRAKRVFSGSTAHRMREIIFRALLEAEGPIPRQELMKSIVAAGITITAKSPDEYLGRVLWKGAEWFKNTKDGWTLTGTPLPTSV